METIAVANKPKPNYVPFGNKKSGPQEGNKNEPRDSKKIDSTRDHHDSRKGGGGNNTGKPK
jgi:hypothetical protein